MTESKGSGSDPSAEAAFPGGQTLKLLTTAQVLKIDDILARIGPFGEVRLVKSKGKLRFITRIESEDAVGLANEDEARAK